MSECEFYLSEQAAIAGQRAAALEPLQSTERVVVVADTARRSGVLGHELEQFAVGVPLLDNARRVS